ncbi:MAG: hypothetical protein ACYCV4_16000 [Dermatophilaceae bacterium]
MDDNESDRGLTTAARNHDCVEDMKHTSPWASRAAVVGFLVLGVIVFVLLVLCAVVLVPSLGGFSIDVWASGETWSDLARRSPYILQAFGNLGLFWLTCLCGAVLFSRRAQTSKATLSFIAAASLACTLLLHAMVWGIDLFVPSSYSLLAPYHRSMILFPALVTEIYGHGPVLDAVLSAFIHTLAPQVLLPLALSVLAIRRLASLRRTEPMSRSPELP